MGMFEDVEKFHRRFGLPVAGRGAPCAPMDTMTAEYRLNFLREELVEFQVALARGRLDDQLDALVDLAWVAMGTAHYMGAPFQEAWDLVAAANMRKVRKTVEVPGDHKRGTAEVIRKPFGWEPPDVQGAIDARNRECSPEGVPLTGESGGEPSPQGEAP
jgi:predicted HAD superfamily Cof-like phosphohydrolase